MKGDDVGYAFLFNLICTSTIMLCMIPELRGFAYVLDKKTVEADACLQSARYWYLAWRVS